MSEQALRLTEISSFFPVGKGGHSVELTTFRHIMLRISNRMVLPPLPPIYRYTQELFTLYRVSHEEWTKIWEGVPYVELYLYNPKHLYPKLNGYGDNGQRGVKL